MSAQVLRKNRLGLIVVILILLMASVPSYGEKMQPLKLKVGEMKSLYVMEDEKLNTFADIRYKSISENIATVSEKGIVTGVAPGQTSIEIFVLKNGNVKNAYVNINVTSDFNSLDLPTSDIISAGELYPIQYELSRNIGVLDVPENLIWTSSNLSVADVDAYGNVYPYASGRTVITAQTNDGVFKDSISLVVMPSDMGGELLVNNGYTKVLRVGEVFTPEVLDSETRTLIETGCEILNFSPEKVEVTNCEIKAIDSGDAKLIYIDKGNMTSAVLNLKIYSQVAGINLKDDILTYDGIGEKHKVIYTLISDEPEEIIEDGVKWYSSNSQIVKVEDGIITTNGYGKAEIVAETIDGQHRDSVWVNVVEANDNVTDLEYTWINLKQPQTPTYVGAEIPLEINTAPIYDSLNGFSVNVSNGSSDQIEMRDGVFYFIPMEPGRYTLYARTPNGKVSQASVYARTMLSDVEIDDDMISVVKDGEKAMYVGEKVELKANIETAAHFALDEVNWPELEWTSSNPTVVEIQGDYLVAHHLGETTLQVKTKDGSFSDNMQIGVYPTVIDFTLPEGLHLPVGETYTPKGDFRTIYRFEEPIIDTFEIKLAGVYLSKQFIERQIEYFEKRKDDIMNNRYTDPYYLKEARAYETQISLYEDLLESGRREYYLISDSVKNKLLDDISFISIRDEGIIGLRAGRVDLKLMSLDNEQERPMSIVYEGGDDYDIQVISQDGEMLYDSNKEW